MLIVPAPTLVGASRTRSEMAGRPLYTSVSLAVGSPPLTVMLVSPVGVFGLSRLISSLPARALIVKALLFENSIDSRLFTVTRPLAITEPWA